MSCNCCKCCNLIPVTSITLADGVTTITVPQGTTFENGKNYCLGLFTSIPAGTIGSQVNVTDGVNFGYTIYNKFANYWRPCCGLKSRTILKLRFCNDPAHLILR